MLRRGPAGVDEEVAVTLRHPGGALSQLRASLTATGANGLEILGDAGALAFDGPVYRPWGLRLRRYSARGEGGGGGRLGALREHPLAQSLQRRLAPFRGPRWTTRNAPYAGNGCGHEAAEVMARLRADETESPVMPLSESVALVALMERLLAERPA